MNNQCPECGGQNAMHYTPCPHAPAMPRVSALRTALPKPTAPGKLPYMHGQQATGHEVIFAPNASASWACSSGSISVDGRYKPEPSVRLSTCPAKEETLIMKVTNHIGRHPFTHRDKGGRYALTCISKPAGEVMRKVGVTVVYHDIHTRQQYSRDLEDFVRIMVPIPD